MIVEASFTTDNAYATKKKTQPQPNLPSVIFYDFLLERACSNDSTMVRIMPINQSINNELLHGLIHGSSTNSNIRLRNN
jgi:hypothetical protein